MPHPTRQNFIRILSLLRVVSLVLVVCFPGPVRAADSIFDQSNLAAWCIAPFDAKKRGPEKRAAMLERMGVKQFADDCGAKPMR